MSRKTDEPESAGVYVDRGNAYYGKGDYDSAINDYSKAIELEPDYAIALSEGIDRCRLIS